MNVIYYSYLIPNILAGYLSPEAEDALLLLAQLSRSKKRSKTVKLSWWFDHTNKGIYCFICNKGIKSTSDKDSFIKEHGLEHLKKIKAFI